jgi:prepilin-type processing-associated H-X9-DG protein
MTVAQISSSDGTANTMMTGEVRIGRTQDDARGSWALGFPGASIVAGYGWGTDLSPNSTNSGADSVQGAPDNFAISMGNCTTCVSQAATLRSSHSGGVNIGMADGSVRFIRDSIMGQVLYQLGAAADGLPTPDLD